MRKIQGFSLLELCIVLVIIGVLSAIALPGYQSHLLKTRRTDGQTALFQLALGLEKYAVEHQQYEGADFENLHIDPLSSQGYYQLKIIKADSSGFLIAAEALKSQARDKQCAVLAMNDQGEKGKLTGNKVTVQKECW
jgi:type IV pilus assembly protein PilE